MGSLRWADERGGGMTEPRPARQQTHRLGQPRTLVHKVRVSPEQEQRLVAKAAERAVTVSRLLVESALAGSADGAAALRLLTGELFDLQRSFAAVGNNLNQVARATNATREQQPELLAVIERLEVELVRIRAWVDRAEATA